MLEQFSATVGLIYAAASDPAKWSEAFASVEQLTDCAGVVVNMVAKDAPTESLILSGPRIHEHVSAEEVEEYNQDLTPICPRVAAGIADPLAPFVCDYMLLSEAEMDRNAVYDWYGRHGLRYFIGSTLGETPRYRLMWSLQRTPKQHHVQKADVEIFQLLKPHVRRALTLAEQLGTIRNGAAFNSSWFDTLPHAALEVDADGTLMMANSLASKMLQRRETLRLEGRMLRASRHDERRPLEQAILHAAQGISAAAKTWVRLSRVNGGPPFAAFVAPLSIVKSEILAASPTVLVIVQDTADLRCADPEMLVNLYGLTGAEARLTSAISGGHSIESAASLLGIRQTTARSTLKTVFRKIGVSRQQDLIRLLISLANTDRI